MSKTKCSPKATVALEKYLDEAIRNIRGDIATLQTTVNDKFAAQQAVADKAEQVLHEKLHGMNEFRDQIKEERGSLMTRELCDARMTTVEEKATTQEVKQAFICGRDAALVGLAGLLFATGQIIIQFFFRK